MTCRSECRLACRCCGYHWSTPRTHEAHKITGTYLILSPERIFRPHPHNDVVEVRSKKQELRGALFIFRACGELSCGDLWKVEVQTNGTDRQWLNPSHSFGLRGVFYG